MRKYIHGFCDLCELVLLIVLCNKIQIFVILRSQGIHPYTSFLLFEYQCMHSKKWYTTLLLFHTINIKINICTFRNGYKLFLFCKGNNHIIEWQPSIKVSVNYVQSLLDKTWPSCFSMCDIWTCFIVPPLDMWKNIFGKGNVTFEWISYVGLMSSNCVHGNEVNMKRIQMEFEENLLILASWIPTIMNWRVLVYWKKGYLGEMY